MELIMNDFAKRFYEGTDNRSHKWVHYMDIYDRYYAPFRGKPCTYLEVGVERGGSLDIMRDYLGPQARIIGMDIDPGCKQLEQNGYEIHIGNQSDRAFMDALGQQIGLMDIILDDGGHTPDQQITTFYALWPQLKEGGIYMVEDMHANLWAPWQSSRYGITFFDLAKGMADKLTYMYLDPRSFNKFGGATDSGAHTDIDNFVTNEVYAIHFYDSIIVFEKRKRSQPRRERR
jgi:hypothetical protein